MNFNTAFHLTTKKAAVMASESTTSTAPRRAVMTISRTAMLFVAAIRCDALRVTLRSSPRVPPRAPLHTTSHRDAPRTALRYNPRNGWDDDESGPDIPSTDLFAGYADE